MSRSTLHGKVAVGVSRIATRVPGTGHRPAKEAGGREHRELQVRYDALQAEHVASEQRRAELLSLIAHDLKNPLSPLVICLQLLTRSIPLDHAARRSVELIKRSADELGAAIDELSDVASIDLGKLAIGRQLAPADAGEMIAEAVEATRRRIADRRLDVAVAEGLPPVLCDRHRMVRVLVDLIIRALRITPRDAGVAIRAQRGDDGAVVISVTDGGPAVPDTYRHKFFELPASTAQQRATGQELALSLYVARGIVEAHGGWMEMESEGEGERGNTVSLTLPGDGGEE